MAQARAPGELIGRQLGTCFVALSGIPMDTPLPAVTDCLVPPHDVDALPAELRALYDGFGVRMVPTKLHVHKEKAAAKFGAVHYTFAQTSKVEGEDLAADAPRPPPEQMAVALERWLDTHRPRDAVQFGAVAVDPAVLQRLASTRFVGEAADVAKMLHYLAGLIVVAPDAAPDAAPTLPLKAVAMVDLGMVRQEHPSTFPEVASSDAINAFFRDMCGEHLDVAALE